MLLSLMGGWSCHSFTTRVWPAAVETVQVTPYTLRICTYRTTSVDMITKCKRNRKEYKDECFSSQMPVLFSHVLNREKVSWSTSRCHKSFVITRKEATAERFLQLKANSAVMKADTLQDEHKWILHWHHQWLLSTTFYTNTKAVVGSPGSILCFHGINFHSALERKREEAAAGKKLQ